MKLRIPSRKHENVIANDKAWRKRESDVLDEADLYHSALVYAIKSKLNDPLHELVKQNNNVRVKDMLPSLGITGQRLLEYHNQKYNLYLNTLFKSNKYGQLWIEDELWNALEQREKALASEYIGMLFCHLSGKINHKCQVVFPLVSAHVDEQTKLSDYFPDYIGIDNENNYHLFEAKGSLADKPRSAIEKGKVQLASIGVIGDKRPASRNLIVAVKNDSKLAYEEVSVSTKKQKVLPIDEVHYSLGYYLISMLCLAGYDWLRGLKVKAKLQEDYCGYEKTSFRQTVEVISASNFRNFQLYISSSLLQDVVSPWYAKLNKLKGKELNHLGSSYLHYILNHSDGDGFTVSRY